MSEGSGYEGWLGETGGMPSAIAQQYMARRRCNPSTQTRIVCSV